MNGRRMTGIALAGLLLMMGLLSATATDVSAAFNPAMWVNIPTVRPYDGKPIVETMGLWWEDMGSHIPGYRTWDLVVRIDAQEAWPNNDWTTCHLEVSTTAGSIFQVDNGFGLPTASAYQSLWPLVDNLQWDTCAIGAPRNASGDYIIPWVSSKYGTPELVPVDLVCDSTNIEIDWYDFAEEGPGTYHIFRLTVSDDWSGTFGGFIQDDVTSGIGVFFEAPEPLTMSLLAIGAAGILLRRRRIA